VQKRRLGSSHIEIAPLVLGGNVFGWTVDEATSFRLLDAFLAAGFNCIDTADVYSRWAPEHRGGESESVIGKWMKQRGCREQVILATKVGMDMGEGKKGLSRAYILQAVEDSLRRLQTDYIDLYQSHIDDAETPQEITLETYAQLVKQGKVRAIGASNFEAGRLRQALQISARHGYPSYQCLQPHYNLCERSDYETNLEPVCAAGNLGVIPYFSLAAGFLTGKYRSEADLSKSPRGGGLKKYLNERGMRILAALDATAKETNAAHAAIALAWLLARPSITAPIASATNLEQLQTLVSGTRLKLDDSALERLNQASE
jgi:aryl-alcohol dehydrogenase-like predicted oxidoreductase